MAAVLRFCQHPPSRRHFEAGSSDSRRYDAVKLPHCDDGFNPVKGSCDRIFARVYMCLTRFTLDRILTAALCQKSTLL